MGAETYKLDSSIGRKAVAVTLAIAERVNIRRSDKGLPSIDGEELTGRVFAFVIGNDIASLVWYSPELVESRNRQKALHPDVNMYSLDCVDGRIPRITKGAVPGIKTEHAQASLFRSRSTGLWLPQDKIIQQSLEDTGKTPLQITRAHNRHCKAWELTLAILEGRPWTYLNREEERYVRTVSAQEPELGNLIFAELTNSRAFDAYYQLAHGLPQRKRVGVAVIYDLYTTGLELVTPLVSLNEKGETVGFPALEKMNRLNTRTFVEGLKRFQETLKDPHIPELGSFKDDNFDLKKLPDVLTAQTDLTVAICAGRVERNGETWEVPSPIIALRERLIDDFIARGYSDLPTESQRALRDKVVDAAVREYLSVGQQHTQHHQEVHGSVSSNGRNVGMYQTYQTMRVHVPTPEAGEKRIPVACAVLDGNEVDGGKPHVFFVSGESKDAARSLAGQLFNLPVIENLITQGRFFPIVVVQDSQGIIRDIVEEPVRLI